MAKVLYLSYTGIMQPLGESQVMQYLLGLSVKHELDLVSFERKQDVKDVERYKRIKNTLDNAGINWHVRRYHKKPGGLATVYDVLILLVTVTCLQLRYRFNHVHCRSYVPSIAGLLLKRLFKLKFIFDMRGFWPDERVDGNIWPKGSRVYRVAKWFEQRFLISADTIISLTQAGVDEIKQFDYLSGESLSYKVIPTCTNLDIFKPYQQLETETLTVGFVGSVGTWYLFDEMVRCYKRLTQIRPNIRLLVLNRSEQAYIKSTLRDYAIDMANVEIRAVNYAEVAQYMSKIDIALFFIKPVFSKKASAPTKMGEFLACGIPCLSNTGVGDVDTILQGSKVGVCISDFDQASFDEGWREVFDLLKSANIKDRCNSVAKQYFSLEKGVDAYDEVYNRLNEAKVV